MYEVVMSEAYSINQRNTDTNMKETSGLRDNEPPNSRLFIVCGKTVSEEEFRETFEAYGTVEKVEIHKDRKGDSKGIAYVKFSKTSEAAQAIEEMNGRCIGEHPRPLKVLVAHNREQGSARGSNDEERLLRLFVVVPRDLTEQELKEEFDQWGAVQYVNIVRDRDTKESKGFAYVKYYRLVHAAKAFESCNRSYKPVFAEPRPARPTGGPDPDFPHNSNGFHPGGGSVRSGPGSSGGPPNGGSCSLSVNVSPLVSEDQLWRLFDLIPGLEHCELTLRPPPLHLAGDPRNHRAFGLAVYSSPNAASYARQKLHGFEYPPGERLIVKPADHSRTFHKSHPRGGHQQHGGHQHQQQNGFGSHSSPAGLSYSPSDLKTLADSIAQATSLIKAASFNDSPPGGGGDCYDPSYCSVQLPSPRPLAPMDSTVVERLFVVCSPGPPPLYSLKDVFARFGGLIDFYLLNGKRCGYALFSSEEAAKEAMRALNGQEVCGARMKVMLAEPSNKQQQQEN